MTAPNDLSPLVSARLCHDLVSPLGAIGNGLELMQMSGNGRAHAEIALISDSLDNALGKLRFLRVAFGPAEPLSRQSLEEAAHITRAAFPGRFVVRWSAGSSDMPRSLAKVLYLTLLCLEKSLPLGGEVEIRVHETAGEIKVQGRRTAAPPELWAHVLDGTPLAALTSDAVQFALLRACLEAQTAEFSAAFEEAAARLRVVLPASVPA